MKLHTLLLALSAMLAADFAQPANYPVKPVSLVVPFPAGGRTDLTARLIAQFLHKHLGQPVVGVNKPWAGCVLGAK